MTDLQKLIADARRNVAPYRADLDAGKYVPGIGLIFDVERLANALEALNRENEELAAKIALVESFSAAIRGLR